MLHFMVLSIARSNNILRRDADNTDCFIAAHRIPAGSMPASCAMEPAVVLAWKPRHCVSVMNAAADMSTSLANDAAWR